MQTEFFPYKQNTKIALDVFNIASIKTSLLRVDLSEITLKSNRQTILVEGSCTSVVDQVNLLLSDIRRGNI